MKVHGLTKIITGFSKEDIVNEEYRRYKPTMRDLNDTIKFLSDFEIYISISDIPPLGTMAELLRWRKSVIKEELK